MHRPCSQVRLQLPLRPRPLLHLLTAFHVGIGDAVSDVDIDMCLVVRGRCDCLALGIAMIIIGPEAAIAISL